MVRFALISSICFLNTIGSVSLRAQSSPGASFYDESRPAFSPRFDEIKAKASPEQLFAFLDERPKRGELHNHAG